MRRYNQIYKGSTRSHCAENALWKRLWTGRKTMWWTSGRWCALIWSKVLTFRRNDHWYVEISLLIHLADWPKRYFHLKSRSILPRRPWSNPSVVHFWFLFNKMTLRLVFLRALWLVPRNNLATSHNISIHLRIKHCKYKGLVTGGTYTQMLLYHTPGLKISKWDLFLITNVIHNSFIL
jgi:hypothetical protein